MTWPDLGCHRIWCHEWTNAWLNTVVTRPIKPDRQTATDNNITEHDIDTETHRQRLHVPGICNWWNCVIKLLLQHSHLSANRPYDFTVIIVNIIYIGCSQSLKINFADWADQSYCTIDLQVECRKYMHLYFARNRQYNTLRPRCYYFTRKTAVSRFWAPPPLGA